MIPAEILKKVRRIQILTSALVHDVFAGQYHSAFKGLGMEFEEVREYQPGDDVRAIDWNVTARSGRPFVKRFREERELTVLLAVDVSASQDFGTNEQLKRDLIAELGATLAFSAIQNNDKVGLLLFTDHVESFVPARKGPRHVLRVIRELLYHQPLGVGTDVSSALEYVDRVLTRRAVVFVLSDFQAPEFSRALRTLRHRHDLIPVRVSDRRERELPAVRFVEFFDPETGRQVVVDTASAAFRRRYADQTRAVRDRLLGDLRRLGLDLIDVETGSSFIPALTQFFRRRGARR